MKPTSIKTKIAGLFFALLMCAAVLGATVAGMVAGSQASGDVVSLERTVVLAPSATAIN